MNSNLIKITKPFRFLPQLKSRGLFVVLGEPGEIDKPYSNLKVGDFSHVLKKAFLLVLILFIIPFSSALCQFASSASANSQSSGSQAIYATGAPDAPIAGCSTHSQWSGNGYSWTPLRWSTLGVLTLKYLTPVYVENLTIFGDYDICYKKITLQNSITKQSLIISDSMENSCIITKLSNSSFKADTIILETCKTSWSATDAVQLCGQDPSAPPQNPQNTTNSTNLPLLNSTINKPIYIITYVGDIDGAVSELWFPFYAQLADFFNNNKIPSSLSFFPISLDNSSSFKQAISKMYSSQYIELIQKGDSLDLDSLSLTAQKQSIFNDQQKFKIWAQQQLGIQNPQLPKTYDQIGARFTQTTLSALEQLNFISYFDVYVGESLSPVQSTNNFDVLQYGVSFTTTGAPGPQTTFRTKEEIIKEINEFNRSDVSIIYVNNTLVLPLWAHQQDFESTSLDGSINSTKWEIFTSTILQLSKDKNVKLITPAQLYNLRHNTSIEIPQEQLQNTTTSPTSICQFASSASANSQSSGSQAIYATGAPDASVSGCSTHSQWSGNGYSWTPLRWSTLGVLTLKYLTPVYVENLTIFGDYDICYKKITLQNSITKQSLTISDSMETSCIITKLSNSSFKADTIILETCKTSWSATDAVQLCGQDPSAPPQNPQNATNSTNVSVINIDSQKIPVEICTWKNCKNGAVSVSVDDTFLSCKEELERYNYRGTYFLSNTNTYSSSFWKEINSSFHKGHEIATHTRNHFCSKIYDSQFILEVEKNIEDITYNTDVKRGDIVTHAQPCGFTSPQIQSMLKNNWNYLSSRGYYYNQLEDTVPSNMFDLKSFNSHGYPGGKWEPPNYFDIIDQAESDGKWANLVFHVDCSDDNVIDYLPSKSLWVDTIGNVVRYISLRNNSQISEVVTSNEYLSFKIKSPTQFKNNLYKQEISLKISLPAGFVIHSVKINGVTSPYSVLSSNALLLNVPFPIDSFVEIN